MDIVKVFGTNLKKYRTQKGLSQEKFAEKCGLHRTYILRICCVKTAVPFSLKNHIKYPVYNSLS
jgi:transcriptional regulator with XRE-family HTH domain